MGKYAPLGEFLRAQSAVLVPMTFEEIERVIGAKLPPKAQLQRAWWSNNPSNNVMTKAWLEAGYETEQVDIEGRKLVFRRTGGFSEGERKPSSPPPAPAENRHPLFGILKGFVEIAPGTDLTQPADPEWGEKALAWIEHIDEDR